MLAYLFLVFALAVHLRFLPLPYSFAPVAAALLYFGARMPRKQMWIPVAALATSGVYLSRTTYGYPVTADLLVTWAWYAGIVLLGGLLAKNASALRVGAASLTASVSFFLLSNFAVWAVWNTYPKPASGLAMCYVAPWGTRRTVARRRAIARSATSSVRTSGVFVTATLRALAAFTSTVS